MEPRIIGDLDQTVPEDQNKLLRTPIEICSYRPHRFPSLRVSIPGSEEGCSLSWWLKEINTKGWRRSIRVLSRSWPSFPVNFGCSNALDKQAIMCLLTSICHLFFVSGRWCMSPWPCVSELALVVRRKEGSEVTCSIGKIAFSDNTPNSLFPLLYNLQTWGRKGTRGLWVGKTYHWYTGVGFRGIGGLTNVI